MADIKKEVYEEKIQTGAVNIVIKDEDDETLGTIKINPSDMDIVERYDKVVEELNKIKFEEDAEVSTEEIMSLSNTIKEKFDYLFNYPVSSVLFSKCSPLTVISSGDFFFEDVMNRLAGLIEKITDQRVKKKLAKIKKVTAKYDKKYHK